MVVGVVIGDFVEDGHNDPERWLGNPAAHSAASVLLLSGARATDPDKVFDREQGASAR